MECGDSAKWSRVNMETTEENIMPIKPEDQVRDTSDMAKETIRTLETLGLLRWINYNGRLDLNKY